MPTSAWETYRPVVIDLTRTIRKHIPASNKSSPVYTTISLPTFSVSGIPWLGASFITTEFRVNLGVAVSLITPINPPAGANFCLAVRWPTAGANPTRYRIWSGLGEVLSYPVYAGETIPGGDFTLEVWTILGQTQTSLASAYPIKTSILGNFLAGTTPAGQCNCTCNETPLDRPQDEYCSIFQPWNVYTGSGYRGPFPMLFNTCLGNII